MWLKASQNAAGHILKQMTSEPYKDIVLEESVQKDWLWEKKKALFQNLKQEMQSFKLDRPVTVNTNIPQHWVAFPNGTLFPT